MAHWSSDELSCSFLVLSKFQESAIQAPAVIQGLRYRETQCPYRHACKHVFRIKSMGDKDHIILDSFCDGVFIDPGAARSCSDWFGCRTIDNLDQEKVFPFVVVKGISGMVVEVHSSELLDIIRRVTASPTENPNNNATLFDAHEMIVYLPKFYKELRGLRNSDTTETREVLNLFVAGLLCTFSLFSGGDIWKLRRMAGLSETLWNQINMVSMQFSLYSTQTIFERLEAAQVAALVESFRATQVATPMSDEWCRALNRQIDPSSLISNKPSNGYIKFWTTTLEGFRSFAEYYNHPNRDSLESPNLGEVQRSARESIHHAFMMLCANNCDRILDTTLNFLAAEAKIKLSRDYSLGLSLFPEEYAPTANLDTPGRPTDGVYASKTPLMVASLNGHSKIVGLLLRRGAWVNATDGEGKTSLIMASNNGHSKVVELLLRSKAEVDNTDHEGSTVLIKAVSSGHSKVVELLLRSKADTNAISYNGDTALSISASKGYWNITVLLLENGADPNLSLIDGSTPLMIAIEEGHRHIAVPLLNTNADPNVVTCKGTALGTACKSHDSTSVRLLLRRGADPTLGILSNPPSHRNQAQKLIEQALFGGNHWQKDATRKLRIHFIDTFSKLSSSMKRGLGTERSTSQLRRRQWWSRGIRSIRRVWSGMVPTTILEILRILLVVGGIASTLDDLSQEGIHLEQPRLKREDDSLIEDPHLNFLRNGYLETFKHDVGRWSHAIQCYRDRIMLEGWAVELWGSPTQLFPNVKSSKVSKDTMDQLKGTIETYVKSAKGLFGLSLDDDEAFISNDQEPPVVQELYLGNSPIFWVGDRMQPADSEAATSLETMSFEDPQDIPSDLQYSIMLATYLLAGATFTILLLFLQALGEALSTGQAFEPLDTSYVCTPIFRSGLTKMAISVFHDGHSHVTIENRWSLFSWSENAILRGGAWNFLTLAAYLSYSPLSSKELTSIQRFCENYEATYLAALNSYLMKVLTQQPLTVKAFEDEEQDLGPTQMHAPETPSTDSPFSFELEEKTGVTNSTRSTTASPCSLTANTVAEPNAHNRSKLYCNEHNRAFSNNSNYNRHLRESHGQGRSFTCQKCGVSYTGKDYLIAHEATIKHQILLPRKKRRPHTRR